MNTLNNLFSLKGKKAVISGGAGLYGRQFVRGLAMAGAKVYMASRNVEANEKYAQELRKENLEVYAEYLDLADESSIIKLCDDIYAKEGRVDILVNNSVARTMTGYSDTKENFDKSMTINATGLFLITRAFGNKMCQAQTGSIINIGSYMGHKMNRIIDVLVGRNLAGWKAPLSLLDIDPGYTVAPAQMPTENEVKDIIAKLEVAGITELLS